MKRVFVFLLVGCLAALFVACSDSSSNDERAWLAQPEVVSVEANKVLLICQTEFAEAVLADTRCGFSYKVVDDGDDLVQEITAQPERQTLHGSIEGLQALTTYRISAWVQIGSTRMESPAVLVKTAADGSGGNQGGGNQGGGNQGGGNQGGTTPSGAAKFAGWPELLPEDAAKSGEYYYAYHLCPDLTIKGNKARNYTVCFSASHHCPVWVAAPRHACYEGSASRTDAYAQDPDIPSGIQFASKSTGDGCNKGHMLGSAERTRSSAINRQVFYYTNIAPQYSSGYNTGGGGWNTLEDWIDTKVCADTTYLVIGTYFDAYTDGYGMSASPKKISFGGRDDVSCPTMFYIAALRTKKGNTGKSVLNCSADELMCAAFVRAHNNGLKGQRVTAREMMTIADLEKLTGHTFFVNVPNAPKSRYTASDWGL